MVLKKSRLENDSISHRHQGEKDLGTFFFRILKNKEFSNTETQKHLKQFLKHSQICVKGERTEAEEDAGEEGKGRREAT